LSNLIKCFCTKMKVWVQLVVLVNIVDIGTQKNNLDKDYGGSGVERKLLLP
jgi:hypothetical protein